jgi:hypothetical protein
LRGVDRDFLGTVTLTAKDFRRILTHGQQFPFFTAKEREEGVAGYWETRTWVTSWMVFTDHERHKDNRGWESASTPLQWADPLPLSTVPGTPEVGKNFFLDEKCPVRGFVSVAPTSLAWKDKVGKYEVKLTQGLAVSGT